MKTLFLRMAAIALAVICVYCLTVSAFAQMDYTDTYKVKFSLSFYSSNANCLVEIKGATGTTSITDCTVTLTDSSGNEVKSWRGLSATGSKLIVSKTASGVEQGKTYTLSVTATVHRNGESETVSDSFTRTYN